MTATAVLFDLDGTLTDSRPGIQRTTRYAFARLAETTGRPFPLPAAGAYPRTLFPALAGPHTPRRAGRGA